MSLREFARLPIFYRSPEKWRKILLTPGRPSSSDTRGGKTTGLTEVRPRPRAKPGTPNPRRNRAAKPRPHRVGMASARRLVSSGFLGRTCSAVMCVSRFLPALQALLANLADEHLPFIVTDERQRFCPADYVYVDKKGQSGPAGRVVLLSIRNGTARTEGSCRERLHSPPRRGARRQLGVHRQRRHGRRPALPEAAKGSGSSANRKSRVRSAAASFWRPRGAAGRSRPAFARARRPQAAMAKVMVAVEQQICVAPPESRSVSI